MMDVESIWDTKENGKLKKKEIRSSLRVVFMKQSHTVPSYSVWMLYVHGFYLSVCNFC